MHSIPPFVQSVCLSVRPSVCTSIYPFVCSACLYVQLICLSFHPSTRRSIQSICLSIPLIGRSVCLFGHSVQSSLHSKRFRASSSRKLGSHYNSTGNACPIVCLLIHHLPFGPFRVSPFHASICLSIRLPVGISVGPSIQSSICPSSR